MTPGKAFNAQVAYEAYTLHGKYRSQETSCLLYVELNPLIECVLHTRRFRGFRPIVKEELRRLMNVNFCQVLQGLKSPKHLEDYVRAELQTVCRDYLRAYNQTKPRQTARISTSLTEVFATRV